MRAPIEQVGKNIRACLEAAGAKPSDIIRTRAFVTDADAFSENADMLTRYLGQETKTSSTAAVSLTAGPDFLVEIGASPPSIDAAANSTVEPTLPVLV
jgi:enamine deaminase RidA (YjgF/YER057c/UK114 family)